MCNMMNISYLSYNIKDLSLISRWYFEEWGHLDSSFTMQKIYDGLSEKLKKDDDFLSLIVVYETQSLVAVADLKYREHKEYPEYEHWIGGVFVNPDHRGKGYASALINRAKEHAAELGINELYLQCEEHNEGLYIKHGFRPIHSVVHYGVPTRIFKFNNLQRV